MYYIQSTDTTGLFIWGKDNLRRYIGWGILHTMATWDPATTPSTTAEVFEYNNIINYINNILLPTNGIVPAKLQAYWHGYCFYRGFVHDVTAINGTNSRSVRRNHIYQISVTQLKGPGIANPNDIIYPHLREPEPIPEAEPWSSLSINVMNWHIINQKMQNGLNN
jgi:hypothetical protein